MTAGVGTLSLGICGARPEPQLLWDGPSYLEPATQILAGRLPDFGLRPPVYPAMVAAALWLDPVDGLARLVSFQGALWVAAGLLVWASVWTTTRRPILSAASGALFYTLSGPLELVPAVYAETTAMTLGLGAVATFLRANRSGRGSTLALSALLALAAALTRPVFQVLLIGLGGLALADRSLGLSWYRRAAPFAVAAALGLLPAHVRNAWFPARPLFFATANLSLANYLGDRRLLGHFPPEYAYVDRFYQDAFRADPARDFVPWWDVIGPWRATVREMRASGARRTSLHQEIGRATRATLARNPSYYVTRWWETWREFSTTVATPGSLAETCPAECSRGLWRATLGSVGQALPFLILLVQLALWAQGFLPLAALAPIVAYLGIGLANTAVEPWPGQLRYRAPLEGFLVASLAVCFAARPRRRRRGAAPEAQPLPQPAQVVERSPGDGRRQSSP